MISDDATIVHPPHGFVSLTQFAGSDLEVVNAARCSFDQESEWEYDIINIPGQMEGESRPRLKDNDEGLIRYLMKHKHGTPFEHNFFQFHVRAPIFVFREWHRHRIGISINEESARYVPLEPDFYLPDDDHCRKQIGKPGHYEYVPMDPLEANGVRNRLQWSYQEAYGVYQKLMEEGCAKEIARAALPVGIYSQMRWCCNARSLMAFLNLRNAPNAQREIRDYAQAMEDIFATRMPVTWKSFIDCDRIDP